MERRRINNHGNNHFNLHSMPKLTTTQETIAGGLIIALGLAFLVYLQSTNTPPVIDASAIDYQVYHKKSYQLKPSFDKYMEHVYNDKFGNASEFPASSKN
jgi:hypothetical protein